jgi:serine/threonine protein kinase
MEVTKYTIDEYKIANALGEGNSSQVYHGYDSIRRRDVALKLFKTNNLERFSSELRFLNNVRPHPNILECYSV